MCPAMEKKNPGRVPAANETMESPEEDEDDEENDEDVMAFLENKYVGAPRRSLQNLRRLKYVESIHAKGFRFLRDDDFLV